MGKRGQWLRLVAGALGVLVVATERLSGIPPAGREVAVAAVPPAPAVLGVPERLEEKVAPPEVRRLAGQDSRLVRTSRPGLARPRAPGGAPDEPARSPSASASKFPLPRSATRDSADPH